MYLKNWKKKMHMGTGGLNWVMRAMDGGQLKGWMDFPLLQEYLVIKMEL